MLKPEKSGFRLKLESECPKQNGLKHEAQFLTGFSPTLTDLKLKIMILNRFKTKCLIHPY